MWPMNNTVTPIRGSKATADKQRPDDRGQIRDAITAQRKAEAAVSKHREAVERARALVINAEHALDGARAAVAKAKVDASLQVAEQARGGYSPPKSRTDDLLRAARLAEMECEDHAEAAKAALAVLEAEELGELEQAVLRAKAAVVAAVNGVIAAAAGPELEAAQKAIAQYHIHRAAFWALILNACDSLPDLSDWRDRTDARDAAEAPLHDVISRGNAVFGRGLGVDPDQLAVNARNAEALRRWRTELLVDADASLPPLPE
jgi:hypothetical protein